MADKPTCPKCRKEMIPLFHTEFYCPKCEADPKPENSPFEEEAQPTREWVEDQKQWKAKRYAQSVKPGEQIPLDFGADRGMMWDGKTNKWVPVG